MHYERLAEESRLARRTVADALEVLRKFVGFTATDRAKIRIDLLKLPSSEVAELVNLEFAVALENKTYFVSLRTNAASRIEQPRKRRPLIGCCDFAK
ncbi:MAG: hypothetical protein HYX37_03860 [Rhizobiales bacterium]|jgi:hypothetical protein|nr:hypothetical protein [Hyphomicrobiales bacterium]